jgi:DNA-binding transcriptional LysR family regulator
MSSEPDWGLYRTLLAVLDEGSLSGAARSLGLTQPTVARHLDQLEAALGRRLFVRTQRGHSPTEAAEAIRPHARAMAAAGAALRRAASADRATVAGTVRISASEVVAIERLPPVLADLRARHPALAVELVVSNAVEDLLRRDADIAVRMVDPVQEALVARRIGNVEIGLHATPGYLARRGKPATLAEVADFELIGYDRATPAIRAMLQHFPELPRERMALATDSDVAQLAAIRAGFGIGACQVGLDGNAGLVRLLPEAFALSLPVWVVMHEDLRSSPRCRAAFDALAAGLLAQIG